jgi:predicted esterase
VYLPLVPRSLPAPIVLIGRPTSGIADMCAPSKKPRPERNLALPFAARGFVAISPDFAGLGNEGTHAYLDNREAANELFDGARALKGLALVGDPVAAVGYSQGGGVVLSAQALEQATMGAHTLKGVAAIAPEWPISTKSFGYEDVLRNPNQFTSLAGLSPPTVTVLRHYGFFMNKMGATHGGDAFPSAERSSIIGSIESLCTVQLGGALDANQTRLSELVDESFRTAMLACIDGGPGCTGNAQMFHQWITSDFVAADPNGARVLIVQGLADQVMPAAGEAACDVAKLRAEGVQPEICSDSTATHDTVLERRIEDVVAWIEAVATGATAPTCSSQTLPACNR